MAKNKITVEPTETGYKFTGSLRQPTAAEISNYCNENHLYIYGVYITAVKIHEEWLDPEDVRTVEIAEFGENCPVCSKALDLSGVTCPTCGRHWDEDVD